MYPDRPRAPIRSAPHSIANPERPLDVDEAPRFKFSQSGFFQGLFPRFEADDLPIESDYGETAPAYGNTIAQLNAMGQVA